VCNIDAAFIQQIHTLLIEDNCDRSTSSTALQYHLSITAPFRHHLSITVPTW
jgi:hypothetical protein